MNWTLDQLSAFVIAVEKGSFSAAARELGKAQSRVSTAVANLEIDLGLELFDRSARLPRLTAAGEQIYQEAKVVLRQCQRMDARALTVSSGEEATLTVAMDEALPIERFESFFVRVAEQFPGLKLTLINSSQDDIARWVDEKKADLGILFRQTDELLDSLEFNSIAHFQQSLIVGREHPLANIAEPSLDQLNQHRQLVIRSRIGDSQSRPVSSNHWHIDSYYYITALVIKNVGWALVPEHVATAEWYAKDLVRLSGANITDNQWVEIGVVRRRDKGIGPVMQWMLQQLARE